mmetsp:Transcript_37927/g.66869  ORF Transcript_37927/g.66869 Transcript_37927/m.66869 type:complete len:213 (-) Transcript_37927:1227-1865(-)
MQCPEALVLAALLPQELNDRIGIYVHLRQQLALECRGGRIKMWTGICQLLNTKPRLSIVSRDLLPKRLRRCSERRSSPHRYSRSRSERSHGPGVCGRARNLLRSRERRSRIGRYVGSEIPCQGPRWPSHCSRPAIAWWCWRLWHRSNVFAIPGWCRRRVGAWHCKERPSLSYPSRRRVERGVVLPRRANHGPRCWRMSHHCNYGANFSPRAG